MKWSIREAVLRRLRSTRANTGAQAIAAYDVFTRYIIFVEVNVRVLLTAAHARFLRFREGALWQGRVATHCGMCCVKNMMMLRDPVVCKN
jgi:hypothetical protein